MDQTQTSAHLPEPDAAWRQQVDERLDAGVDKFKTLQTEMEANTEITREIRDVVLMGRTVFRALSGIGKALTWCWKQIYRLLRVGGVLAAAGTAIWAAFYAVMHGGQPPK